jgi:hypothetical protein
LASAFLQSGGVEYLLCRLFSYTHAQYSHANEFHPRPSCINSTAHPAGFPPRQVCINPLHFSSRHVAQVQVQQNNEFIYEDHFAGFDNDHFAFPSADQLIQGTLTLTSHDLGNHAATFFHFKTLTKLSTFLKMKFLLPSSPQSTFHRHMAQGQSIKFKIR